MSLSLSLYFSREVYLVDVRGRESLKDGYVMVRWEGTEATNRGLYLLVKTVYRSLRDS